MKRLQEEITGILWVNPKSKIYLKHFTQNLRVSPTSKSSKRTSYFKISALIFTHKSFIGLKGQFHETNLTIFSSQLVRKHTLSLKTWKKFCQVEISS